MTGTTDRRRSLFLVGVLIASVFAATVALPGSAVGEHDTSDTLDVSRAEGGSVSFEKDIVQDQVGDVADITVRMENTVKGTVVIGSADQNYWAVAYLTDGDDDGEVTVAFNTYTVGAEVPGSDKVWAADRDDDVTLVTEDGSYTDNNQYPGDKLLDATEYDLNVSDGHRAGLGEDAANDELHESAYDIGVLSLQDRTTNAVNIWTVPKGVAVDEWDVDEVVAGTGTNLTEDTAIAPGDYVVFQVQASGVEGVFEAVTDAGSNPAILNNDATTFDVERTDGGANVNAGSIELSDSNVEFIADGDNDTYYVVVPVHDEPNSESGGEYEATFSVLGAHDYTGGAGDPVLNTDEEDESVAATFEVVEPEASLDVDDAGLVLVEPAADQMITGQTNRAPGTELSMTIESTDQTSSYFTRPDARVRSDGTINFTVDLSELDAGTNLSVTVENEEYDGRVVEDVEEGCGPEYRDADADNDAERDRDTGRNGHHDRNLRADATCRHGDTD